LSSSATKRKSEHAGSANKQQKTKSIRKLQNGSAYGVEVSQVILGEDSSGMGDNEIQNGVDDEEDEEVPDNLTFGEKTLGLLVEGMNTFQKNMLEFCAFSSKQASATNTILTSLSKKLESTPLPAPSGSSFSSSSSSLSSFLTSPSNGLEENLPKTTFVNSSLANSFMSAMPGIKQVTNKPKANDSTKSDFLGNADDDNNDDDEYDDDNADPEFGVGGVKAAAVVDAIGGVRAADGIVVGAIGGDRAADGIVVGAQVARAADGIVVGTQVVRAADGIVAGAQLLVQPMVTTTTTTTICWIKTIAMIQGIMLLNKSLIR